MAAYYARCASQDPDDLAQEAWLGLLEALPRLDMSIGDPEQFLVRHARWRLLDSIKRARVRQSAYLDDTAGAENLLDHAPDMLGRVWASEFVKDLPGTQQAVLRCLLAGLTWREAGAQLGCSSANIAYHVRQIRRQYENSLDELPTS
jgi:RNA polymerase sigma-70 factor (ECF subfamily)